MVAVAATPPGGHALVADWRRVVAGLDVARIDPGHADRVRRLLDLRVEALSRHRDEHVEFLLGDPSGGW